MLTFLLGFALGALVGPVLLVLWMTSGGGYK